ncbi:hypothetical protein NDU88_000405 [Pleurodeles waltl]|uniref:Uncharacterized protein n=1 Tax=Pleurodeles waltl TaxID=8319 RepID=A0AAV7TEX8_PLEWA|nr:hypothetical protein NDU88_000405 [Pleurodeles waltl]
MAAGALDTVLTTRPKGGEFMVAKGSEVPQLRLASDKKDLKGPWPLKCHNCTLCYSDDCDKGEEFRVASTFEMLLLSCFGRRCKRAEMVADEIL